MVLSFVPSFSPTRWHEERPVAVGLLSQGPGLPIRTCASPSVGRRPCLHAQPADGHAIPQEGQVSAKPTASTSKKSKDYSRSTSRWAKGQVSRAKHATEFANEMTVPPLAKAAVEPPPANPGHKESTIKSRWSKGQWSARGRKISAGGGGGDDASVPEGDHAPGIGGTWMGDEEAKQLEEALAGGEEAEAEPKLTKKRLKKYSAKDFQDSSWTLGIQWKSKPYEIFTTKVALKKDGSVVWLDRGKGSWAMRSKSRDLVFYRDFFWNWNGKRIYSAKLLDNTCDLYLEGVIKGWAPFVQLGIYGYFQAVRRDVKIDENSPRPPWESRPIDDDPLPPSWGKRTIKAIETPVPLD
ncbi:unnamed protein product [Sphacelaria rigidula]